jgi:uncharacterized protein with NRDE domain
MCLLALAYRVDAGAPLIVTANRDEYYARPAAPLAWWGDLPILAGRDLEAGGTWLGVTRDARFAALTNVRGAPVPEQAPTRGALVRDFLLDERPARDWASERMQGFAAYAGFNLVLYDGEELLCASNTPPHLRVLEPGVHAIGNARLDHDWPKIAFAREQLAEAVARGETAPESLLELLASRRTTAAHLLPDTGVGREMEELLSAPFIVSDLYGTRASTALVIGEHEMRIAERRFERGEERGLARFGVLLSRRSAAQAGTAPITCR